MTTEHYTSPDGVAWTHRGTALGPREGGGTPAACG